MENNNAYLERIKKHTPHSPIFKNCALACLFSAGVCFASEWLFFGFLALGATENDAYFFVTVTLIFIASFLSAVGVYDRIAKHAGAGLLVPVTGFANAVVSPALDAKAEGCIIGVGAAIFSVAGPVLLFSTLAGTLYGAVLLILRAAGVSV